MRIYTKLLLATLPLILSAWFFIAGIAYYSARQALSDLAEAWLEAHLASAIHVAEEQESLLNTFSLRAINASVKQAQNMAAVQIQAIDIGDTGFVYAVNRQGIVVMHPDTALIGTDVSQTDWFKQLEAVEEGRFDTDWQGNEQLSLSNYFHPWEWYIVVSASPAEIYQPINQMGRYIIVTGLMGALCVALILITLTRRLMKPLRLLAVGAEAIGQGKLQTEIDVGTQDEFQELAVIFNQMALQLRQTLKTLHRRVFELAQTNDRLQNQIMERQLTEASLRESETKYRNLFENSLDMIVVTDLSGLILDVSPVCLELLGYTSDELIGLNSQQFYNLPDPEMSLRDLIQQHGALSNIEIKVCRKDNTLIDCLLNIVFQRANDGKVLGFHGVIRDMTERRQAEEKRLELANLQQELTLAHEIQNSLLPASEPEWVWPQLVCYSLSALDVGGDWYAYYHTQADQDTFDRQTARLAVAVGDVSGKGMPGALLMAVGVASYRSAVMQHLSPSQLLTHLDNIISSYTRTTNQNCALTCLDITPNGDGATVRAVNAGCISPLIKRQDGSCEWINVGGLPLGTPLSLSYEEAVVQLATGEMIILVSDGVVEAFNSEEEMFSFERLEKTIASGPLTDADAMMAHLQIEIIEFMDADPHDDLTIVVIQV